MFAKKIQPNPYQPNIFQKIGSAFGQYGMDNRMPADQFLNLPKGDRRQMQVEGLRKFSEAMNLIGAQQSGDPQRMALAQNQIRQRRVDEENERQKRAIEAFIQTPEGAPYKNMYTLAGSKGVIAMLGRGGNSTFERFGIYDKEGKLVSSVNKGDTASISKIQEDPNLTIGQLRSKTPGTQSNLDYFSVTDASGKRLYSIVNPSKQDVDNLNREGLFLNRIPTPTDRGVGATLNDDIAPMKSKYLATENIIIGTSNLAKQFANEPQSALAVGDVSKFVDGVIKNIEGTKNILSNAKDSKAYKIIQQSNISSDGSDFTKRIEKVSQSTGVAQSQIKDLAYLFAAARGQEGRGLSDKDFQNALDIVSGGVGVGGRIKVLENVSTRLREEFYRQLELEKNFADDEDYFKKLNKFKELPYFVNPTINANTPVKTPEDDDPLGIR